MKCFECGGEVVQKKTGILLYKKDRSPVFFDDVIVDECVQCGEKYISGAVSDKISDILKKEEIFTKRKLSVPVVSLAA